MPRFSSRSSRGIIRRQQYVKAIRADLARSFPGSTSYFQTADIVSQVLNFGLSSPIDVQIQDSKLDEAYAYAAKLRDAIRTVPGAADVHLKQVLDYPTLRLDVDRQRASEMGLSQNDVANSMLVSLASSALVAPSFYINPTNDVNYLVAVKEPLEDLTSVPALLDMPMTAASPLMQVSQAGAPSELPHAPTQTLGNLAQLSNRVVPNEIDHYTVQRVLDVDANVEGSRSRIRRGRNSGQGRGARQAACRECRSPCAARVKSCTRRSAASASGSSWRSSSCIC